MSLAVLIAGPFVFALAALFAPSSALRRGAVLAGAVVTAVSALVLLAEGPPEATLPAVASPLFLGLEGAVILAVIAAGRAGRSNGTMFLGGIQMLLLLQEALHGDPAPIRFVADSLALILVMVVSLVGSIILLFATGYMETYGEHAPETARRPGIFFFFLVSFLGGMNGLVLADSLTALGVFWEYTTLCSFFLIGHDGSPVARANAKRALFLNTLGGLCLSLGAALAAHQEIYTLGRIIQMHAIAPFALLAVAALIKSAQIPFQSWLLGAMVAPTPVSALLHSATMVKAGSYLLLRLSPAFAEERFMAILAIFGAFSFAFAAALAISQSNAKRVLAYSTISNLGLIVACAGIDTPLAYSAALMILVFHAISKGLLFLCVGTIEHGIGSRDIEDMGDLVGRMPITTLFASVGMISMLVPPFGMLLAKWMAMEAAITNPIAMGFVTAGSALSVVFWCKWIGRIQTTGYSEHHGHEHLHRSVLWANGILCLTVLLGGVSAVTAHMRIFDPMARMAYLEAPITPDAWERLSAVGRFLGWPVLLCTLLAVGAWYLLERRFSLRQVRPPFLCGENVPGTSDEISYSFRSLRDEPEEAWSTTLYLRSAFDEKRLTLVADIGGALILATILGIVGLI
jgi:ech hydrogenase subunit A